MCLDRSAHGVVSNHEVFQKPYRIDFDWQTIDTPANYRKFYNGRKLNPTMPVWHVQKSGYKTDRTTQPGVVAGYWGYEDAPDSEVLAGGINTKGPKYPALGRHGPFFQWGFSASPSQMTESGRRAFVNAICYISKFDRLLPLTRKTRASMARGWALDRSMSLTKIRDNYQALLDNHAKRASARSRAKAKKASGKALTVEEQRALIYPTSYKPMAWERYRDMILRWFPAAVRNQLGQGDADMQKYLPFYERSLDYLVYQRGFRVDADAKALGIPNNDRRILDKAVALLEAGQKVELAQRILTRYTDQKHASAEAWRSWLDTNRSDLFFSDHAGYRFVSSRRSRDVQMRVLRHKRSHREPSADEPVVFEAFLLGTPRAGSVVTLGGRARIAAGWHIYASVPDKSPYPKTKLQLKLPAGVVAESAWQRPRGNPSAETPGLHEYSGTVVFIRELRLETATVGRKVRIQVSWQACDAHSCLPPEDGELTVVLAETQKNTLRQPKKRRVL